MAESTVVLTCESDEQRFAQLKTRRLPMDDLDACTTSSDEEEFSAPNPYIGEERINLALGYALLYDDVARNRRQAKRFFRVKMHENGNLELLLQQNLLRDIVERYGDVDYFVGLLDNCIASASSFEYDPHFATMMHWLESIHKFYMLEVEQNLLRK